MPKNRAREKSDGWTTETRGVNTNHPRKKENEFIDAEGFAEYGKWHLGIDDEADENTKRRYKFPYGDFKKVHRCAVLSAESRAGQYRHFDIEHAAAHLHGMIEELMPKVA